MFDYTQWKTQGAGRVNADGTVTSPGGVFGISVTKPGVGDYLLTVFDSTLAGVPAGAGMAIPDGRLLIFATPIGATPRALACDDVGAAGNAKQVRIDDNAGNPVDNAFVFIVGFFMPAA